MGQLTNWGIPVLEVDQHCRTSSDADKLSMAHGLNFACLVDKEIVEYVERLPANFGCGMARKWLHRQVCRTFLPESILKRPKRDLRSTS
jgi:hypothetical protein